eukprot:151048-Amphidinium_carterae.5
MQFEFTTNSSTSGTMLSQCQLSGPPQRQRHAQVSSFSGRQSCSRRSQNRLALAAAWSNPNIEQRTHAPPLSDEDPAQMVQLVSVVPLPREAPNGAT